MKVPNIKFIDYYNLPDKSDYNAYLKHGIFASMDLFKTGDFNNLSFGFVKTVQQVLSSKNGLTWDKYFELIEELTGQKQNKLVQHYLFNLHMNRLYFVNQIEKINKQEEYALNHSSEPDEVAAGIDSFAKFGAFVQFEKLAGGDILKIEEVKKLPYNLCFTKLYLDTERVQFEKRYNRIKSKKS